MPPSRPRRSFCSPPAVRSRTPKPAEWPGPTSSSRNRSAPSNWSSRSGRPWGSHEQSAAAGDPRFRPYAFPVGSVLALPLKGGPSGDAVFGVLNVADRRDGHGFTSGDLKLGATVAGLASAALENALLVTSLQRMSREL